MAARTPDRPDPRYGKRWVRDYGEVEVARSAHLRDLAHDVEEVLRVPYVDASLRCLANWPAFLEAAWRCVRPVLRTVSFEEAAARLRAIRGIDHLHALPPTNAEVWPRARRYERFVDTVHYALPKTLLTLNLIDGLVAQRPGTRRRRSRTVPLVRPGPAENAVRLPRVDAHRAPPQVLQIYDDVRRRERLAIVPDLYRGLANEPAVLEDVWSFVRPTLRTGARTDAVARLADEAAQVALGFAVAGGHDLLPALDHEERRRIRSILAYFTRQHLPQTMVDVHLLRARYAGAETAARSSFDSLGRRVPSRISDAARGRSTAERAEVPSLTMRRKP